MTQQEVVKLANRISDQGKGVGIMDMLAALGMVVSQALMQLEPPERMPGTVGWIAMLTRVMTDNHKKARAN